MPLKVPPATKPSALKPKAVSRLIPQRLGWRLALGFGLLVALLLAALIQASLQIQLMTQMTQRFATQDIQHLLRVQSLSLDIEGTGTALLHLMNAPREFRVPEYTQVDDRNRRIKKQIDSLIDLQGNRQEETLRKLKSVQAEYFQAFIDFADQIEAEDQKAARKVYAHQVQPLLADMLAQSSALIRGEVDYIEQQADDAQRRFEQMAFWVAAESLLAIGLALFLALRTTRSVVRPLAQLEAAALRIASGDYGSPVIDTTAQEVNRVGQALGTMTQAIALREQEIERLAFRDPITNLHNRTFLLQSLAKDQHSGTSLMLIDLARLKTINETLGYTTGDTTIQQVALRLQTAVVAAEQSGLLQSGDKQAPSVVAHLGGGHFALSFCVAKREDAEQLRTQIESAMAEPVHCSGNTVDLNLAYGLADAGGQFDANAPTQLMRNAEVALNAAKKTANSFAWYSPDQEAARLSHLSLISDLRLAVASSQLQMWLQPKFSLKSGLAVGAEALVRWQHPQRGFVSPAEFVPFAEQTGYIRLVTQWMLNEAMQTLVRWSKEQPKLSIAVNVSTRDLQDPEFCKQVKRMLDRHGVNPQCLRLEIVESGLMEDLKSGIAVLHVLRELGLQLSIDDFGTGYSSLAYLQQLPVTELKIDRSFVDKVDTRSGSEQLVKTMIEMGHGMGLMVTAEGVETQAEKDTLIRLDCDVMQGYFGSRPLHGAALDAWFNALVPAPP